MHISTCSDVFVSKNWRAIVGIMQASFTRAKVYLLTARLQTRRKHLLLLLLDGATRHGGRGLDWCSGAPERESFGCGGRVPAMCRKAN
eukprot:8679875-Pyramimonas_sp.AAC.1